MTKPNPAPSQPDKILEPLIGDLPWRVVRRDARRPSERLFLNPAAGVETAPAEPGMTKLERQTMGHVEALIRVAGSDVILMRHDVGQSVAQELRISASSAVTIAEALVEKAREASMPEWQREALTAE